MSHRSVTVGEKKAKGTFTVLRSPIADDLASGGR